MTIELLWVVTLSVAVGCALVNMGAGWLGAAGWQRVAEATALQWLALFVQLLFIAGTLGSKG